MLIALQHLNESWQTDPAIQTKIVDSFKNIEKTTGEVTILLDNLIDEKQMFEGRTSISKGKISLF